MQNSYYPFTKNLTPLDYVYEQIEDLKDEILENVSWLADDSRFSLIKKIFDENRFYFFRLDFSKSSDLAPFIKEFSAKELKTDTIYLSNVHEYLEDDDLQNYANNVKKLISENKIGRAHV